MSASRIRQMEEAANVLARIELNLFKVNKPCLANQAGHLKSEIWIEIDKLKRMNEYT